MDCLVEHVIQLSPYSQRGFMTVSKQESDEEAFNLLSVWRTHGCAAELRRSDCGGMYVRANTSWLLVADPDCCECRSRYAMAGMMPPWKCNNVQLVSGVMGLHRACIL